MPKATELQSKPIFDLVAIRANLLRHWKAIVAATLVGAGLALLITELSPKQYTAQASGIVQVKTSNDVGGALTGDSIAKSKATQYQNLAKSKNVAADALKRAGIQGDPDSEASKVEAAVPLDTAQINISVTRGNAEQAAALANAWVVALGNQVAKLGKAEIAPTPGGQNADNEPTISVQPFTTATTPAGPSSPNLKLNLALGILAGLICGLIWATVRSKADRRIRGTAILEGDYGLSVVGTLPKRDGEAGRGGRAFLLDTVGKKVTKEDFRSVESFNEIRANLQFMNPDNPPRIIVVSSPLPGEGKSTVSSNLAIAIAESGRRVVLVDGDLRRPMLADTFGLLREVGVTTAVMGQARAADLLQDVQGMPTLRILTSGPTPPNPSEIVGSDAFGRIIEGLAEDAFVIIDAPPVIPVSDAVVMSRRFDGALLVLNAEVATIDTVEKSLSILDKVDASILGTVLNKVPTGRIAGRQYGYYGDYYYGAKADTATKADGEGRGRDNPELDAPVPVDGVVTEPADLDEHNHPRRRRRSLRAPNE